MESLIERAMAQIEKTEQCINQQFDEELDSLLDET